MHAARGRNLRKQPIQESLVALAVKDDDWQMAAVNGPLNVLSGDIVKQGRLAGTRLADHNGLHPSSFIRPEPRTTMHNVSGYDRVLLAGLLDIGQVLAHGDEHGWVRPSVLNPFFAIPHVPEDAD